MKRFFSLLALGGLLSFTAAAQYENTKMAVGQPAPELNYNTPEGKPLSLKQVNKGSYVLLDFWASWCGPCRASNPALVAAYKKYQPLKFKDAPNGFTIYSVSLDRNKDAWTRAITADGLTWASHVSDLKSWSSEAAAIYGVQFIPQAFLLGPDGRILGKYASAEQAAADLEKYVDKGAAPKKAAVKSKRSTAKK